MREPITARDAAFASPCGRRPSRDMVTCLVVLVAVAFQWCGPIQRTAAAESAQQRRPNLVFVLVDDLGKDWIGCYGADQIQTPRIDQLAAEGLKFHCCYSMPQCTPSRSALLTGQYPWRNGFTNHWDVPRWGVGYFDWERYTSFARLVREAGYATAAAGKWQLNDFRLTPDAMDRHGFDDWCMWTGGEGGNPPSNKRYQDPYIHTREGSRTYEGKFGPDIYCDFLIDFARRHRDQPMMLYFPMALTHGPLVPTPLRPKAAGRMERHRAMVEYTDRLVGRLMDAIDQLGLSDNTYFIFTTDNGTAGGVLGKVDGRKPSGGKGSNYEGGVCQPLIVRGPGVPAGQQTRALTDFTDWLPTFAELAGATVPDGLVVDGHSIVDVLQGRAERSSRDWIMALGYGPGRRDAQGIRPRNEYTDRVIRNDRYKIWVNTKRQVDQLYDLSEDPLEQRNLIDSAQPTHRQALAELSAVAASLPKVDARIKYRPRAANPWDRKVKVKR